MDLFYFVCFFSTLYVIGLPYSCQNCTYNQPVYIFLFYSDFLLEDVIVSRSLRQAIDPMNPELSASVDWFKSSFGVSKKVNEIKISVTQKEFLRKALEVSKKKLHQRKIVPVIIWDFGGQDVFYSTHQTFLTYRAIYMLVLDGSRTLDEPCPFEQYLPGKGGAKTQRGSSFFLYI